MSDPHATATLRPSFHLHRIFADERDSNERRHPPRDVARRALGEFPGGLQVGGGVTPRNAAAYVEAGASHVIVTSYVFDERTGELDEAKLRALVAEVGRERLVLDLSCRRRPGEDKSAYYVVTNRWQRFSSLAVNAETLDALAAYADEFLIHGVDVEGKRLFLYVR